MAFEDKQAGRGHAPGRATAVDPGGGATVGKQTRVEAEGGFGEAAPATAPGKAAADKGGAGKITARADKPAAGDAQGRFGVGEVVTFSAPTSGDWSLDGKSIGSGTQIQWTAPDVGLTGKLEHTPDPAGAAAGGKPTAKPGAPATLPVLVIAPSQVNFTKIGEVPSAAPGTAGVGMTLQVAIGPDDVSFGHAEWLEKPGEAENVTGYFAAYVATGKSLKHDPNASWLPMGDDNKGVHDNAWTKDKPKLKHTDGTMRWWAGSFEWSIPNVYRLHNGGEHALATVVQRFTMDEAGAITVSKGAATATAQPDGVLAGDLQKFATQADALAFLSPHGPTGAVEATVNYARNAKADPESVRFLVAALRDCKLTMTVDVTCKNTFSYVNPDTVTLTANGKPAIEGAHTINTGKHYPFTFAVNDVLGLDHATTLAADPIQLAASITDTISTHPHTAAVAFPYADKDAVMVGSDRYTYTTSFS